MAIRLTGLASGLDTDSMVKELVSAYSKKLETYEKDKTKLEWKQEAWSAMNTKIYGFYTGALSSMRMTSSFTSKKSVTVSDPTKATVSADGSVADGTQSIDIKRLARAGYLTSAKVATKDGKEVNARTTTMSQMGISGRSFKINVGGEEKSVSFESTDTVTEFMDKLKKETGLSASFDSKNQRFVFHAESGKKNDFNFKIEDEDTLTALSKLGLVTEDDVKAMAAKAGMDFSAYKESLGMTDDTKFAAKQDGEDALIEVNGALFESESNTLTVNGLTINATGVTNGTISVTTATDTDGIYNMIKDFLKEYNTVVNEMTKAYGAKSAKGYEPLTDEQKDEMSDTEVEKWENKIKEALLRRDDKLNSILSSFNTGMQKGFVINGKNYNLSTFGVHTLGFLNAKSNEENAMHIDGNKEDSLTADAKDKLRAAIESDPDTVMEFFNSLAKDLYTDLTDKMKSTTLSSAYTVYNDKQMKEDMRGIEDKIKSWEKKVSDYEEKWYKQFSKMETTLSELQSQTNSLSSLLGM